MYNALLIQDAWKERKKTREAQRQARAIINQKLKEELQYRLELQRHLEQDSRARFIIRDGRNYDDDGHFIANVL
jgi:hypothetical protein